MYSKHLHKMLTDDSKAVILKEFDDVTGLEHVRDVFTRRAIVGRINNLWLEVRRML
jgi:hypothetical protein